MIIFDDKIGFYTMKDVCRITALSRSTIYRYLERKRFPEPVIFEDGGNLKFWIPDVHSWIRSNLDLLAQTVAAGRKRRGRKVLAMGGIQVLPDTARNETEGDAYTSGGGRSLADGC
ncbi:AlpA family phage regulatory protein [Agrobacterium radiobacter]|uniref:AlpA family phage regulatory protein n=1 Tax=Agrobacterium radiobacter TaxID=362 RepID=A0ABD5LM57_AGRRD